MGLIPAASELHYWMAQKRRSLPEDCSLPARLHTAEERPCTGNTTRETRANPSFLDDKRDSACAPRAFLPLTGLSVVAAPTPLQISGEFHEEADQNADLEKD
jgi:hypothetical protein